MVVPAPRFRIMARKVDGSVFECFTWTRDEASGVDRAFADARVHGVEIVAAWGEAA